MNRQENDWNKTYLKVEMPFPSEYVIRMFKGKYPKCNLQELGRAYEDSKILDISCGIGRDLILFNQLKFKEIAATEITQEIVEKTKESMKLLGINANIKVGKNNCLPFENDYFDYELSWNVCYYFDEDMDFSKHAREYARVLKKDAVLVFSIPKPNCFIYKNAIPQDNGLMQITSDPFGIRNGVLLKCFQNEDEIQKAFGEYFYDFTFGSINDDCFGLDYSWYIGYCRKK